MKESESRCDISVLSFFRFWGEAVPRAFADGPIYARS